MKIILSSRRHHYVAGASIFLIVVALIAGMVGGVGCGCGGGDGGGDGGGGASYTLTIASTAGGSVTTPGEDTFTYNASTVVNPVATPDGGYRFVNWTGDVGTIANVNAASTTITMDGNYAITANFALGKLIAGVPDTNWPPTVNLANTNPNNYCAPLAMVNVLKYWDGRHGNAQGVTAGLPAKNATEYLGYFMDTNDTGSPDRPNPVHFGTLAKDIRPGTLDFVRWDAGNPFPVLPPPPPFGLPAGKIGYVWAVTDDYGTGFDFYKAAIDAGRPLVVCFRYWNPDPTGIQKTDPETGETIDVFNWEVPVNYSEYPEEEWDCPESEYEYDREYCIGHAVTGVGYILNWDPDGDGNSDDYVIVHDTWDTTPENVAIPWVLAKWNSSHDVDPTGNPLVKYDLTISSDIFGSVTTPGEGTFTCDINAVVNLVATPGADCYFVNWTGNVGTVNNVSAANTTIIMNGNYNITANFILLIPGPPI